MPVANEKEFWMVGKSAWNRWQVRKASVSNPEVVSLIEDLGPIVKTKLDGTEYEPIKEVGIEYDGQFHQEQGRVYTQLDTEGYPWLFVITCDGALRVKRVLEELSTAELLATNTVKAGICRCWRNDTQEADQGLLLVYIKEDGNVYYQERRPVEGVMTWSGEMLLDNSAQNANIKVFRLNDYRVAVFTDGSRKLWISARAYIGNTIPDEYVGLNVKDDFFTVPFVNNQIDDTSSLTCESVELLDRLHVKATFNFPVVNRDPTWKNIEIFEGSSTQRILDLDFSGNTLVIQLEEPLESEYSRIVFKSIETNRLGYIVSPQAIPIWPVLEIVYDNPLILQPEYVSLSVETTLVSFDVFTTEDKYFTLLPEYVKLSLDVTLQSLNIGPVNDSYSRYEEFVKLSISCSLVTFTLTQSGDTPI